MTCGSVKAATCIWGFNNVIWRKEMGIRTKQVIKGEREALESKIHALEAIKEKLQELLGNLEVEQGKLKKEALDPILEYKLGGVNDADWTGANFTTAVENKTTISTSMSSYDGEITALEGEIQGVIQQLEETIADLHKELTSLEAEEKSAPDEDEVSEKEKSDSK